jgi:GTP cyclohydrolase I
LSNGNTVYEDEIHDRMVLEANGITVLKERKVEVPKVKMALLTGEGVIEEADWAGRYIPIVPVYGDIVDIDGEFHYSGMVRFGKDAQRVYNYHRTTMIETIANAPKVPYLVTPEQIKGFEGLWKSPEEVLTTTFDIGHEELVIIRDIEVFSHCEHHLTPFHGVAHVGYIPRGKITGLSKVARLVDLFARRPQVQERLTKQISAELKRVLQTEDVAVVIDAHHMCVSMRGVEDHSSSTITADYSGKFLEEATRTEFLKYLELSGK